VNDQRARSAKPEISIKRQGAVHAVLEIQMSASLAPAFVAVRDRETNTDNAHTIFTPLTAARRARDRGPVLFGLRRTWGGGGEGGI